MGIGPDNYGPPAVDFFGMLSKIGESYTKGQDRALDRDLILKRRKTLADLAGGSPTGETPDMNTLGRALLSIGDLEGGLTAAKMAQARSDAEFNRLDTVAGRQLQSRQVDISERTAGLPSGYQRTESGMAPIKGGPEDPAIIAEKKSAGLGDTLAVGEREMVLERLKGLDKEASGAAELVSSANQLRELRKDVKIAGHTYAGIPGASTIATASGWFDKGQGQALEAAATDYKIKLGEKLKGALSDKEGAMLQTATPGVSMSDSAADVILNLGEVGAQRKIAQNRMANAYARKHGSLAGFDEQWDRYKNENPILERDKSGTLSVNRQNVNKWQGYLDKPKGAAELSDEGAAPKAKGKASSAAPASLAIPAGANWPEGKRVTLKSTGKAYVVTGGRLVAAGDAE
jgi:hypothetical protein